MVTLISLITFISAVIFSSFVEYWVHRLMHVNPTKGLGAKHSDHHRRNEGQGFVWELLDYLKGSGFAMVIPLFFSWEVGLPWLIGGLSYSIFAAYAHQLQHENPTRCVWMKMPVHYVHHKYGMWYNNFGIAVDWWDHVFGTYKLVDWLTEEELSQQRGYFDMKWW